MDFSRMSPDELAKALKTLRDTETDEHREMREKLLEMIGEKVREMAKEMGSNHDEVCYTLIAGDVLKKKQAEEFLKFVKDTIMTAFPMSRNGCVVILPEEWKHLKSAPFEVSDNDCAAMTLLWIYFAHMHNSGDFAAQLISDAYSDCLEEYRDKMLKFTADVSNMREKATKLAREGF